MDQALKLADEVWLATALLHQEQPEREGFQGSEILRRAQQLHRGVPTRKGLNPHIYGHCVANARPSSGTYRILYRNRDGTYRLYRDGDDHHPKRARGRTRPEPAELPKRYRNLVKWYETNYNKSSSRPAAEQDPILGLIGVGKDLWRGLGGGDAVIAWLRSDEVIPPPWERAAASKQQAATENRASDRSRLSQHRPDFDHVWWEICRHQGESFQTVRRLPFTYRVFSGITVRVKRNGDEVNQQLPRADFEKAWLRMPVAGPGQLQDLRGPSYLFAILTDPRVSQ